MKTTLTLILLLIVFSASAQKTYTNLDGNKKVATLANDILWIHKRIEPFKGVQEQLNVKRYIEYKGKRYRFLRAYFDDSYFWVERNKVKGIELW